MPATSSRQAGRAPFAHVRGVVALLSGGAVCAALALAFVARGSGRAVEVLGSLHDPRTAMAAVRVDVVVEMAAIVVGVVVAAWFSASLCAAAGCATARAAGRRWAVGERLVGRYAPEVVRRALLLCAGTGLALAGTGLPAAAVVDDAGPTELGWSATISIAPRAPSAGSDTGRAAGGGGTAAGSSEPAPPPAPPDSHASPAPRVPPPAPSPAPPEAPVPPRAPAPVAAPGMSPGMSTARSTPASRAAPPPPPAAAPVKTAEAPGATAPTSAAPVTVRPGDTLWDIAAAHLPPGADASDVAAAWPAWYAANMAVVGDDPDIIRPGQRLVPPPAVASTTTTGGAR